MGEEREKAMMAWLNKHRPDCVSHVQRLLDNSDHESIKPIIFAMVLAFESGRMFQSLNPEIPYDITLVGAPMQSNLKYG